MGEKEVTQKKATEKKVIDANDKKKVDEGPITVVLKLDLHCDGCAKKVKKSLRYIEGVESVKAESTSNKLTITGKVNPMHIKERVEYKTKKKVEIISPKPKKDDDNQGDKKAAGDNKPTEAKSNDQKPKEPQSTSVVLKIPLHCDGCIQKIKRIILKIDGVEYVKPDGNKNLVAVKGTMNMKELVPYLKDKLKRNVDVVPPKKEDKGVEKKDEAKVEVGEDKKDEKKAEGGENKKDEKKAEGGENKKLEKQGDQDGESKKKNDVQAKEADNIKSVEKKKNGEGKVASGESEKNKSGGEAKSIGGGDGDGSKNVNVMNKFEYYRHNPAYTYTMPVYNQNYHNQDYGVPVFPTHGYGNEGYVSHGYAMGYHGPPPPPSPLSIHTPPVSENDILCSIM